MSDIKAAPHGMLVEMGTCRVLRPATEEERNRSESAAYEDDDMSDPGSFMHKGLLVWVWVKS